MSISRSKAKIIRGPSKAKTVSKIRRSRSQSYGNLSDWMAIRSTVLSRDGYKCVKCGSTSNLQVDHIIEVSRGGSNAMYNLRTLCAICHSKRPSHKSAKKLILHESKHREKSKVSKRR